MKSGAAITNCLISVNDLLFGVGASESETVLAILKARQPGCRLFFGFERFLGIFEGLAVVNKVAT
jgi:hypothetical protein